MKTFVFALDLKDDPAMIAEYERYHTPEGLWPDVAAQIKRNGVISQQMYRVGTRVVLVLSTTDDFDLDAKRRSDAASAIMQEWELLMDRFQLRLPQAESGQKWTRMTQIFDIQS